MKISGMEKLTLLDYPTKTACLIFTQGCNLKCPFCQNSSLLDTNHDGVIDENEVLTYLDKRKGVIDGICISGGEPLLQKDLEGFIKKVKDKGFKVKLDTNGSNPKKLKDLLDKKLLDYVAMDIKNDFTAYDKTSGIDKIDTNKIKESIKILEDSDIEYEFRTTIVKELHDLEKIENICKYLNSKSKYYLQNYRDCETVLQKGLTSFSNKELQEIKKKLSKNYPNLVIRGID